MSINSLSSIAQSILTKPNNKYFWYSIQIRYDGDTFPFFFGYIKVDNTNNEVVEFYETINNETNFSNNIFTKREGGLEYNLFNYNNYLNNGVPFDSEGINLHQMNGIDNSFILKDAYPYNSLFEWSENNQEYIQHIVSYNILKLDNSPNGYII